MFAIRVPALRERRDDVLPLADRFLGGNKAAAARLLGITRRRLYSRLESLGTPIDGGAPSLL